MSAAAIDLVSKVSVDSVIKSFQSGVNAVIKYGKAQQGDRTMVGCIYLSYLFVYQTKSIWLVILISDLKKVDMERELYPH